MENLDNMKLDIKESLFSNFFWFILIAILMIFITKFVGLIESMSLDSNKIVALIVLIFSASKMFAWISSPKLIFKDKKKPYHRTMVRGY